MTFVRFLKSVLTKATTLLLLGCPPLAAEVATPIEYGIEAFADGIQKWDGCGFADDVHGFFDVSFKSKYVTPRGLLVSNKDLTTQFFTGLILDLYKNPYCVVNQASFVVGAWNDLSFQQDHPNVGAWNELDWFVGLNFTFCNNWHLNTQYIEFVSPPNLFKTERNFTFTLVYDDSAWGLPITFNPYAKLFYAISGDSTVIVGERGGTYYADFGMLPVYEVEQCGLPVVITAPTWISVGPAAFWNGGVFGRKDENSNLGVFSTGLTGAFPISCISSRLGKWYFNLGAQYYYLINDNLLEAQAFQLENELITRSPQRNIAVATCGISFYF